MSVQRKLRRVIVKRLKADNIKKNERIGELLGLEPIPVHHLAYKEERLDRSDGDCYPLVDVLKRIAEIITVHPRGSIVKSVSDAEAKELESGMTWICNCGFQAKTKAGLAAHQRKCEKGGD